MLNGMSIVSSRMRILEASDPVALFLIWLPCLNFKNNGRSRVEHKGSADYLIDANLSRGHEMEAKFFTINGQQGTNRNNMSGFLRNIPKQLQRHSIFDKFK